MLNAYKLLIGIDDRNYRFFLMEKLLIPKMKQKLTKNFEIILA